MAIHIFKLLMNGYTPFGGIIETASVSQSSPGVGDAAVRKDSYCFKPGYKHQSAAMLPLEALPLEIEILLTRAFIFGKVYPLQRPNAAQWHAALARYEQRLVHCVDNPLHQFDRKNSECPLCKADLRFQNVVRNDSAKAQNKAVYTLQPRGVWKQVVQTHNVATAHKNKFSKSDKTTIIAASLTFVATVVIVLSVIRSTPHNQSFEAANSGGGAGSSVTVGDTDIGSEMLQSPDNRDAAISSLHEIQSVTITYAGLPITDFIEPMGSIVPLRVRVEPAGVELYEDIVWTSSDTNVFEVVTDNPEGTAATVTIVGSGSANFATLTVSISGLEAMCIIKIAR